MDWNLVHDSDGEDRKHRTFLSPRRLQFPKHTYWKDDEHDDQSHVDSSETNPKCTLC